MLDVVQDPMLDVVQDTGLVLVAKGRWLLEREEYRTATTSSIGSGYDRIKNRTVQDVRFWFGYTHP
jgi:hypothetical protein